MRTYYQSLKEDCKMLSTALKNKYTAFNKFIDFAKAERNLAIKDRLLYDSLDNMAAMLSIIKKRNYRDLKTPCHRQDRCPCGS